MPLEINSKAPDFTLPSTEGSFSLSKAFGGKPCVLYFYPKDFTKVCTREACTFRDEFSIFEKMNIDIVGISRDSIDTHLKFKAQYTLPFTLLSDAKGLVAKKYDALVPILMIPMRVTYLLDKNHRIAGVYNNMFNADNHVKAMLTKAKSLQR